MKPYRKLIKNSLIFAIGSFGSRIVSFVLLPVYTLYLSSSEYGTIDVITTTATLLLPLVSLSIYDAVLRYVLEDSNISSKILTNSILVSLCGFLFSCLFLPLVVKISFFRQYYIYLYLLLFFEIIERILSSFCRGIGYVKRFAFNGMLKTFTSGLFNVLFLVFLKRGVEGYFISLIISTIISIVFLTTATKSICYFSLNSVSTTYVKLMVKYSIPLIPNSIMWWVINGASRFMITTFIGISANGLYAIASKIPAILNMLNSVFAQAWQLSAIEEYNKSETKRYYSNVFRVYSLLSFGLSGVIMILLKPIFFYIFSSDYSEAWIAVPFLLLGTIFSSFSGFIGTTYLAAKNTKGSLKTSLIGGIVSLILNALFIPFAGLLGAAFVSFISFTIMFILRYFDTKDIVGIEVDWKRMILNTLGIVVQFAAIYLTNMVTGIMISSLLYLLFLIGNRSDLAIAWEYLIVSKQSSDKIINH